MRALDIVVNLWTSDLTKNCTPKRSHLHPHWFGEPPDHRIYCPFYAKSIRVYGLEGWD